MLRLIKLAGKFLLKGTLMIMQRRIRLSLLLTLLLLVPIALRAQTSETTARLKAIDEYASRVMRDWRVPGFAMAIVKDDRVILVKGCSRAK